MKTNNKIRLTWNFQKLCIHRILVRVFFVTPVFFLSCEDFVAIDPPNSRIVSETLFADDQTATAAVTGIYITMMNIGSAHFANGSSYSVALLSGLASDELVNQLIVSVPDIQEFNQNEIDPLNSRLQNLWATAYNTIYQANSVIEGIANSPNLTPGVMQQLEGEVKFIRAFCYFYLINLFGDVPLVITTDYRTNALASRTSVSGVYEQIIQDLKDAEEFLAGIPLNKVRANKWAATALLARVYLYNKEWSNAEVTATAVIDNLADFSLASNLNDVFKSGSQEAIWQLRPLITTNNGNTFEGDTFLPQNGAPSYRLTSQLLNDFETGDNRAIAWIGAYDAGSDNLYYPYKYKLHLTDAPGEYSMVLRLAEQYLIRAEARAQQNNLTGPNSAESDINTIRNRAGLANTAATTKDELLEAVIQERRVELFTEWGHRWLDLKRTGRANAVLETVKPNWDEFDVLYPIPEVDMLTNPRLTPQNPGY